MQTYTVKPGTKLYSVPWGTYKQEVVRYLVQVTKLLKRLSNNKLINLSIYMEL